MKRLFLVLMAVAAFSFAACSADNAADLFETAEFEELQNNREHAVQLYNEIIRKYPESDLAGKAKDRLKALRPEPPAGRH